MMMYNFAAMGGFGLWHSLGWLVCLAFITGLVFFGAWAIKYLKKEELKQWAMWLLVVGIVGGLLLSLGGGFGHYGKFSGRSYGMMGQGNWEKATQCVQDETCNNQMEDWMDRMMGEDKDDAK